MFRSSVAVLRNGVADAVVDGVRSISPLGNHIDEVHHSTWSRYRVLIRPSLVRVAASRKGQQGKWREPLHVWLCLYGPSAIVFIASSPFFTTYLVTNRYATVFNKRQTIVSCSYGRMGS